MNAENFANTSFPAELDSGWFGASLGYLRSQKKQKEVIRLAFIFISTNYLIYIIHIAASQYTATQDSQREPSWTKNHLASANLNHS